jgi:ATP synthase protein I
MTTETTTRERRRVLSPTTSPLVGTAVVGLALVLLLVLLAALVGGSEAATGAALGGGLAVAVFVTGLAVVNVVARVMPSASLVVALLTYSLQVVLMALVVLVLVRADVATSREAREWFAGAIIAVTMVWLAVQVWLVRRQRIPVYDLSSVGEPGGES